MKLYLRVLLDFIFPPSEDEVIVRKEVKLKLTLQKMSDFNALSNYRDPAIKSSIHLVKYHNHPKAKRLLSGLLYEYLVSSKDKSIIIPIPLSRKRLNKRGYNQVTEVIKPAVAKISDVFLAEKILVRIKHTTPQTTLNRTERLTNVIGAFDVVNVKKNANYISGKHIILVDDVATTGATLSAAKAALLPHSPASITCLALAH